MGRQSHPDVHEVLLRKTGEKQQQSHSEPEKSSPVCHSLPLQFFSGQILAGRELVDNRKPVRHEL